VVAILPYPSVFCTSGSDEPRLIAWLVRVAQPVGEIREAVSSSIPAGRRALHHRSNSARD